MLIHVLASVRWCGGVTSSAARYDTTNSGATASPVTAITTPSTTRFGASDAADSPMASTPISPARWTGQDRVWLRLAQRSPPITRPSPIAASTYPAAPGFPARCATPATQR